MSTIATAPAPLNTAPVSLSPVSLASGILDHAAAAMPPETPAAPAPSPAAPAAPAPAPASGPILTDRSGRSFNPATMKAHADGTPFVNRAGYFMPIGGVKKTPSGSPAAAPAAPAPAPGAVAQADAWTSADRAAAAQATAPDPATAPGAQSAAGSSAPAPAPGAADSDPGEDARLSPEAAGELGARALYTATGALIGDHARAAATGAEHANITKTVSAYLRFRGIAAVGTIALVLTAAAYLMDEKRRSAVAARLAAWFKPSPRPAPRAAEPAPAAAAPGPATPAAAEVVDDTPNPGPAAGPAWAQRLHDLR